MTEKRTELITVRGVVQGVGFRPTVYRIAQRLGMKGTVRNMGGIVRIVATGQPKEIDTFVTEIVTRKPLMSRIDGIERLVIETTDFRDFSIAPSAKDEDEIAVIPADIAMCEDCEQEFYDKENPRYMHPFISCTNCGPRYTIMKSLPYDRDTTTMDSFPMCEFCEGEYTDPSTRRYHAQTVSCHECGPQPILRISNTDAPELIGEDATLESIRLLREGGVIALKGVGGYYLVCSPFDEAAVSALRRAKHREEKPFAIMYRDIAQIKNYCVVSYEEELALNSPKRPIVLLEQRPEIEEGSSTVAENVCGGSRFIGAFLPSFGLQLRLLDETGPLIMTSANLSDHPIVTNDYEIFALAKTMPEISAVLYHTRLIEAGLDDSVIRVIDGKVQLIRRSKGYVPSPILAQTPREISKDTTVFAAGPHLKSVLALSRGPYAYLSRHLGDTGSIESEKTYQSTFYRMTNFFGITPKTVVCDMHPLYFSTRFAEALEEAQQKQKSPIRLIRAQHHHAHIASVIAEHGLAGPVIGVAFDGTGYGMDEAIWGGEILFCEGPNFVRFSHLKYVSMLGGDSSAKDAWKAAASHLATLSNRPAKDEFEIDLSKYADYAKQENVYANTAFSEAAAAIEAGVGCITSSSMGRLFDAVSSMLGICQENRYEGECASMLENAAYRAMTMNAAKGRTLSNASESEQLALEFHLDLAQEILKQCMKARFVHGINIVCLSGGVFQNRILMEETLRLLRANYFEVYYNIHVPPNDGGIALGQCYIGMLSNGR